MAEAELVEEAVDPRDGGSDFRHGGPVQLKVAAESNRSFVGLFPEHNFIDESRSGWIQGRQPWHGDAGELALEGLEEAHEVPDSEYMVGGESG